MNGYITVNEAAQKWNVTERQVQRMCGAGMIPGATHFGKSWAISEDALKPTRTGKLKPGRKSKSTEERV